MGLRFSEKRLLHPFLKWNAPSQFAGYHQMTTEDVDALHKGILEDLHAQLHTLMEEGNEDLRVDVGVCLDLLGRPEEARVELALAENRGDPDAFYPLGRLLLEQKLKAEENQEEGALPLPTWTTVVSHLRDAIQKFPDNMPAHYYLGKAILKLVKEESIKNTLDAFQTYMKEGTSIGHAKEVQDFINSQDPELQKTAAIQRGKEALAKKDFATSQAAFEEAIQLGCTDSYYHLGEVFEQLENFPRAVDTYLQAKTANETPDKPSDPYPQLGKAIHALFGNFDLIKKGIEELNGDSREWETKWKLIHLLNHVAAERLDTKYYVRLNLEPEDSDAFKEAWNPGSGLIWLEPYWVDYTADFELTKEGDRFVLHGLSLGQKKFIFPKMHAEDVPKHLTKKRLTWLRDWMLSSELFSTLNGLGKGDKDINAVTILQKTLYQLGFGAELKWETSGADGDYGETTHAAVQAFAEKSGISASGKVVTEILAFRMASLLAVMPSLHILTEASEKDPWTDVTQGSSENKMIQALQHLLNVMGFKVTMDGKYEAETIAALRAMGKKLGLDIPDKGARVDQQLVLTILNHFSAALGPDWKAAKPETVPAKADKAASKSLYFRLPPHGDQDFTWIEKRLKQPQQEMVRTAGRQGSMLCSYTFSPGQYALEKEDLQVPYVELKKFDQEQKQIVDYFHQEVHPKDQVVLHFTAGPTHSSLKTLTQPGMRVSSPFLIGRDGTIYKLFDPEHWAFHLGRTGLGDGLNERSISIEIANFGPLTAHEGRLLFGSPRLSSDKLERYTYCSLEDTEAYIKLGNPYNAQTYFASYTAPQYESLIRLLRYLTEKFNIKRQFLPADPIKEAWCEWDQPRYTQFKPEEAQAFKGICSHLNYREAGKWDIGPAFDWEQVIRGVQAKKFIHNI